MLPLTAVTNLTVSFVSIYNTVRRTPLMRNFCIKDKKNKFQDQEYSLFVCLMLLFAKVYAFGLMAFIAAFNELVIEESIDISVSMKSYTTRCVSLLTI